MENKENKVAVLYDLGDHCIAEDVETGKELVSSVDKRKVYYQTKAMGYEVIVKSSYDDEN